MNDFRVALELLAPHCDLSTRLRDLPWTAQARGVQFNAILDCVEQRGLGRDFAAICPLAHRSAIAFYPVSEMLIASAAAGMVSAGPKHLHEGIRDLAKVQAMGVSNSLLSRALLRLLASTPKRLFEQGIVLQRHTMTQGKWTLLQHSERVLEMVHEQEYLWIESALLGAGLGTLELCGIQASAEVRLRDRYNGSIVYRW